MRFILLYCFVREIGWTLFPRPTMAISRVQVVHTNSGGLSINPTLGSTVAGNLLVAVVSGNKNGTGASTITPPGGGATWLTAGSKQVAGALGGQNTATYIFYYPNNPGGITAVGAFTSTGTSGNMAVVVSEWSGMAVSPLDPATPGVANGTTAAATTGSVGPTAQASELIIGGISTDGAQTWNTPLNGFSITGQDAASTSSVCALESIVSSTGTYSSGATGSIAPDNFAGVIVAFEASGSSNINVSPAITSANLHGVSGS